MIKHKANENFKMSKMTGICGSDESGKGEYFGGLAVCAFYLDKQFLAKLELNPQLIGQIRDSKKIDRDKVGVIAQKIYQLTNKNNYVLKYLSPLEYNDWYAQANHNLNILLVKIHDWCYQALVQKQGKLLTRILDQFCSLKNYQHYQNFLTDNSTINNQLLTNTKLITKADEQYLAVAIASILARDCFLQNLQQIEAKFQISLSRSNNLVHIQKNIALIKQIIPMNKEVKDFFKQLVKLHFKYSSYL